MSLKQKVVVIVTETCYVMLNICLCAIIALMLLFGCQEGHSTCFKSPWDDVNVCRWGYGVTGHMATPTCQRGYEEFSIHPARMLRIAVTGG